MILGFGNNVVSSLASDITAGQTAFSVLPGDGPLFSALLTSDFSNKSTALKTYAKITLTDSGETAMEVCHLTAVNGDTLTVIRGQEGTVAKGWLLKDVVANFATRGSENAFPQIAHIQSGFYTSGTAGGTANSLTLELPATFFLNGSADWVLKTPIVVYPSQNNTGPATLQLTLGGKVIEALPLYKGSNTELVAGDIMKDIAMVCVLNAAQASFTVMNPGGIYYPYVKSVNSEKPDAAGNVNVTALSIGAVTSVNSEKPDAAGNVNVTALSIGAVTSVNSEKPDAAGNVNITIPAPPDLSPYITIIDANARFISDMRLGVETSILGSQFVTANGQRYFKAPAGSVVTGLLDASIPGGTSIDNIDIALVKAVQKLINGQWYTIGFI